MTANARYACSPPHASRCLKVSIPCTLMIHKVNFAVRGPLCHPTQLFACLAVLPPPCPPFEHRRRRMRARLLVWMCCGSSTSRPQRPSHTVPTRTRTASWLSTIWVVVPSMSPSWRCPVVSSRYARGYVKKCRKNPLTCVVYPGMCLSRMQR